MRKKQLFQEQLHIMC